jgi:hypothetical protein
MLPPVIQYTAKGLYITSDWSFNRIVQGPSWKKSVLVEQRKNSCLLLNKGFIAQLTNANLHLTNPVNSKPSRAIDTFYLPTLSNTLYHVVINL